MPSPAIAAMREAVQRLPSRPQGSTLTTRMELDVEVEYAVSGRHVPAITHGPADGWAPEEFPEVELTAVFVSTKWKDGTTHRVDILPALSSAEEQALLDEATDHAAEAQQDNRRASVEAEADAARGR